MKKIIILICSIIAIAGIIAVIIQHSTKAPPKKTETLFKLNPGYCSTDAGYYSKECRESDPDDLSADYMLMQPNVLDF